MCVCLILSFCCVPIPSQINNSIVSLGDPCGYLLCSSQHCCSGNGSTGIKHFNTPGHTHSLFITEISTFNTSHGERALNTSSNTRVHTPITCSVVRLSHTKGLLSHFCCLCGISSPSLCVSKAVEVNFNFSLCGAPVTAVLTVLNVRVEPSHPDSRTFVEKWCAGVLKRMVSFLGLNLSHVIVDKGNAHDTGKIGTQSFSLICEEKEKSKSQYN